MNYTIEEDEFDRLQNVNVPILQLSLKNLRKHTGDAVQALYENGKLFQEPLRMFIPLKPLEPNTSGNELAGSSGVRSYE